MQIAARSVTGIEHTGSGTFARFVATPDATPYGDPRGYPSLDAAIDALTTLTIGSHRPAAGIYERDGRFTGHPMTTELTFTTSGVTWRGPWRLEQHPSDRAMFDGSIADGVTTRHAGLRAVVDGAQLIHVEELPIGR